MDAASVATMDAASFSHVRRFDEREQFPDGFIIEASKTQEDAGKLFIGGISRDMSKQALLEYLSQFGEIIDFIIKVNPHTGFNRGFGFVLFRHSATVERVLHIKEHRVDGKKIELKKAKAVQPELPARKVFVGGLNPRMPEVKIREYFGSFGEIVNIELPLYSGTNERRAFCFITYSDESILREVLKTKYHYIGSSRCEVKLALPREHSGQQRNKGRNVPLAGLRNRRGAGGGFPANLNAQGANAGVHIANPNAIRANRSAFRANPNTFGANPSAFGANPNAFGANPNAFGANPNAFGANPSAFGANPNAFGANPNTFGANPNAFGANPRAFGANPNAFGANPNAFGANPNAFGTTQNAFGANPNTFGAIQNTFGANPNAFGANPSALGANPVAFGATQNAFGANPNTFGPIQNTFGANPNVLGAVGGSSGGGLPSLVVPVPFCTDGLNSSQPLCGHFQNVYGNQPVFPDYSGNYFIGYNYGTHGLGPAISNYNPPINQATPFDNGYQGIYPSF